MPAKAIIRIDKDGNEKLYEKIYLAAEEFCGSTQNICAALSGKSKTAYGYRWKYADPQPEIITCFQCKYNNTCLTQSFVESESATPFDRYTWFCADAVRKEQQ